MNRKRHKRTRFQFAHSILGYHAVRKNAIEAKDLHEAQLKREGEKE